MVEIGPGAAASTDGEERRNCNSYRGRWDYTECQTQYQETGIGQHEGHGQVNVKGRVNVFDPLCFF